ncbi:MAG: carbon starvation CstA family protein, partial [Planctomycetota bacterium]|nr:carbon starvation CstA family protein [Planctomycetota bacterium]
MNVALVMVLVLVALALGYLLYGRLIARLVGIDPDRTTPATKVDDGVDYVPTKPFVLFGHHYSSIAAAGPIVGPAVAMIYGWLPGLLWMVFGVIFIGAVHDFTSLFVSIRQGGKSVAEVARNTLGKSGFFLYVVFAIILCVLVAAAFLDLTAKALTSHFPVAELNLPQDQTLLETRVRVTEDSPEGILEGRIGGIASTSVIVITFFAPILGFLLYRRKLRVLLASAICLAICAGSIWIGFLWPLHLDPKLWMGIVLVYCVFAGFIPLWVILQPRDFTNVHLLFIGLAAMSLGLVAAGLQGAVIDAPMTNFEEGSEKLGLIWPIMFVVIACGSVSGAHGLVCGGTTCRQVANEKHAPVIGYGGMLLETLLGVCVVLCIGAGLGFAGYKAAVFGGGAGAPIAFAAGVGQTLTKGFHLPPVYGTVFGILLLEGFLVTTTDTIIRLSRYLLEEFWKGIFETPPAFLQNRAVNTVIIAGLAGVLAFNQGYRAVWPVFGAANQLLAALTLIAATAWLLKNGKRIWFT